MSSVAAPIRSEPTGFEGQTPDSWLGRSQRHVEERVRRFPGAAVATALTMGAMLGWLIKRH